LLVPITQASTAFDDFYPNACAICGVRVFGYSGGVPVYYCAECYGKWKDDIIGRAPWAYMLYKAEHARRKRRTRRTKQAALVVVSLDAIVEAGKVGIRV
jgi:hypothetical protein